MNPLAQVYAVSLLYDSANALQRYHTRWPAMPDNNCQHNAGRVWQTRCCCYRHQAVQGGRLYMYIGYTNTHFKRIGTMVGDGRRWSSHTCLTVQMVLCTSTSDYENALTYKVSFARSSSLEISSIDILAPKIWYRVPHASNDQNISQTTSFQ